MSSFGMELEICCWEPSHDILSQNEYPEVPSVSPEIVKLLESSDDCAPTSLDAPLIYPRPIAVYQEDLHLANFGLLDSGWLLSPPAIRHPASFARLLPSPPCFHSEPASQTQMPPPTPVCHADSTVTPPPNDTQATVPVSSVKKEVPHDSQTEDEIMDNSDTEYTEESGVEAVTSVGTNGEGEEMFKLGTSKSPVIEAFIYCALKGWGVHVKKCTRNEVEFTVSDFDRYYAASNRICSKHRPTEDISARIKGLKRWFPDFPARKSQISESFTVSVGKDKNKLSKIRNILHKNRELAGICKLRRSR